MSIEIQCSNLEQLVATIRKSIPDISEERYFIAGPCGIGKTTLGRLLAQRLSIHFIDHDEAKASVKIQPSPCWASTLRLSDCLNETLKLEKHPDAFVFAVGGDSLFRKGANNDERLMQLFEARARYNFVVIVFVAEIGIVEQRFLQVKDRRRDEFTAMWENWKNVEKPYWEKCADYFIEISKLSLHEASCPK